MSIEINDINTNGLLVNSFLDSHENISCFVPICPYSYMANPPFLKEYIPWLMETGHEILIIVGDYLERHNIAFFKDVPIDEAWQDSRKKGNKILKTVNTIISEHQGYSHVNATSTVDFILSSQCKQILSELESYFKNNNSFRKDVLSQTENMLENTNRMPTDQQIISKGSLENLCRYMLEEIALYIFLYQRGYQVEIYPGRDMEILQKMVNKQYPNFPYDYKYRTHISVTVSPNKPFYSNGLES
ncbi:MAG: tRNA-dependent cyclodipeptide synthase [Victivallales bacterium]|nr:tRNA-dependent cyclodipeptide synthase [Victivallales bacterium]